MIGVLGIFKAIALRLWAVLFVPVNRAISLEIILEVLLAIGALGILWAAVSRVNRQRFLMPLALTLLAAIPVAPLLLIGPDLEKSRYLYLPSAMFAMLLVVVMEASDQRWIIATAALAFHIAALEHNLKAWEHASAKAESACAVVAQFPQSREAKIKIVGLPQTLQGVYFYGNGFPECVELRNPNHATLILQGGHRPTSRVDATSIFQWDPVMEDLRTP